MRIQEQVPLSDFTTMRVGGNARFFCCVKDEEDLKEVFEFIKKKKLPFFTLGAGSNVIFSDEDYNGVVVKMEMKDTQYDGGCEKVFVSAVAGVVWDEFVEETLGRGLFGLENLSLIPGTVGAAPVQNIGAYGSEVKDFIESVVAFNTKSLKFETFCKDACAFGYRDSFFKTKIGRKYIITRVTFVLSKKISQKKFYEALQKYFDKEKIKNPTPINVRDAVIKIRNKKLPDVKKIGSAGSFFKNPIIPKVEFNTLIKRFPEVPHYTVGENEVKIPAGWLIDRVCGLRGIKDGKVGTYKNQALVIVNYGEASAEEIKQLAEKITKCVEKETKIKLEREVQYVN